MTAHDTTHDALSHLGSDAHPVTQNSSNEKLSAQPSADQDHEGHCLQCQVCRYDLYIT